MDKLQIKINTVKSLSQSIKNLLERNKIYTVGDLIKLSKYDLCMKHRLGFGILVRIEDFLWEMNLKLEDNFLWRENHKKQLNAARKKLKRRSKDG